LLEKTTMTRGDGLHHGQPVRVAGREATEAEAAMILVHGRGGTAEDMLGLAARLGRDDFSYLAPQAAGRTWYPFRFLSPLEENEPHLSSALRVLDDLFEQLEAASIPAERVFLLGFSQGACLTLEWVARNARRYGGAAGLSGGLIGPPGRDFAYEGSLAGTEVFLGCSDTDPHIPLLRVEETAGVLTELGASVTERIYPGMGHIINADEIEHVRAMMSR
jgi:predicted esterase